MRKITGVGGGEVRGRAAQGGKSTASKGESPNLGHAPCSPDGHRGRTPQALSRQKGGEGPGRITWTGHQALGWREGRSPGEGQRPPLEKLGETGRRAGEGVDRGLEQRFPPASDVARGALQGAGAPAGPASAPWSGNSTPC